VLDPSAIIASFDAHHPGQLAAKQVVHEAHALEGVAVTREPEQYQLGSVPLLVV
jgi:hypothetical protein